MLCAVLADIWAIPLLISATWAAGKWYTWFRANPYQASLARPGGVYLEFEYYDAPKSQTSLLGAPGRLRGYLKGT